MSTVDEILRERTLEFSTLLQSELLFGEAWTKAATHEQRRHRLEHVYLRVPWTYADGPSGFDEEHPLGT